MEGIHEANEHSEMLGTKKVPALEFTQQNIFFLTEFALKLMILTDQYYLHV